MSARVLAVSRSAERGLEKATRDEIIVVEGLGVDGDIHAGVLIRHLARMRKDPTKPNLRQVHLLHAELFDELAAQGLPVEPGQMGENVTTRGIPLLELPTDTILRIGSEAVLRVTGLRNPCKALEVVHDGLMEATLERLPDGELRRKAGVMSVVVHGGTIRPDDVVVTELPPLPHRPLAPV